MDVQVRPLKRVDLSGGVLVVGIPHTGSGNVLFTDYLLEQLGMDQIAAVDAEALPAIAMVYRGKPRFPIRIHADARTRVSVLRCEFPLPPSASRPLARCILDWAHESGVRLVLALDGLQVPPGDGPRPDPESLWFVGSNEDARRLGTTHGITEFDEGILGGTVAVLLLEGRFRSASVLTLLAPNAGALDDGRNAVAFARALSRFVPDLPLDLAALRERFRRLEATLRTIQKEAEKALRRAERRPQHVSPMYG